MKVANISAIGGRSVVFMALCLLFMSIFFGQAHAAHSQEVEVSVEATEARIEGVDFAISDFTRFNKGSAREYQGTYFGYRYPMAAKNAFAVVVVSESKALVYVPSGSGLDIASSEATASFEALLEAIDARASNGGITLSNNSLTYEYTSETSVVEGGYRYEFGVQLEPGYYYTCIYDEQGNDASSGALFSESGLLVSAQSLSISKQPEGFEAFRAFLTSIDFRPFWVSLRTSVVAMLFVFVLGLLAAWFSQRISNRFKDILDSILTIPMVLPPTVCGFLLLVAFGNSTALGQWLLSMNIELIFSWPAAVIAAIVVSFPLMYRTARGAFEGLDPSLGDAARTLGWSERHIFFKLTMPLSWPSIAAGTVLAFARAMGEFGATLFVAGNYPGVTQTMPIAIYFEWMGGHSDVATFWVFVVILFSFVVILFVNRYAARTQRYRKLGSDSGEGAVKR
ncbi:MAG TPA: molybdate ABC transporter permease subunit [Coriobacteriia bacterium]|nr:molybdate ABC transporter permease subunit [Coriobacteriia bacterium]